LPLKDKPAVFVVEDDPSVLRSLRRVLTTAGFDVQTFDRPSALLKHHLPRSQACLVIDVHLPEMNGVELCQTLAESKRLLPVVLITAHGDERTRQLIQRANPVTFLIKPFARGLLLAAVEKALAVQPPS
jgi:FixJ family two-component response regulator